MATQHSVQLNPGKQCRRHTGTARPGREVVKPFGMTILVTRGLLWTIRADGHAAQRLELFGADRLLICEARAFILISTPIHIKGLIRSFVA